MNIEQTRYFFDNYREVIGIDCETSDYLLSIEDKPVREMLLRAAVRGLTARELKRLPQNADQDVLQTQINVLLGSHYYDYKKVEEKKTGSVFEQVKDSAFTSRKAEASVNAKVRTNRSDRKVSFNKDPSQPGEKEPNAAASMMEKQARQKAAENTESKVVEGEPKEHSAPQPGAVAQNGITAKTQEGGDPSDPDPKHTTASAYFRMARPETKDAVDAAVGVASRKAYQADESENQKKSFWAKLFGKDSERHVADEKQKSKKEYDDLLAYIKNSGFDDKQQAFILSNYKEGHSLDDIKRFCPAGASVELMQQLKAAYVARVL